MTIEISLTDADGLYIAAEREELELLSMTMARAAVDGEAGGHIIHEDGVTSVRVVALDA